MTWNQTHWQGDGSGKQKFQAHLSKHSESCQTYPGSVKLPHPYTPVSHFQSKTFFCLLILYKLVCLIFDLDTYDDF